MKKFKLLPVILACLMLASCSNVTDGGRVLRGISDDAVYIYMSDEAITVGGEAIANAEGNAVYLSNDIVYYKDGTDFTYGEGTAADMHTAEEAAEHKVINITEPGDYVLSGTLSKGQIAVDLGEDAEDDPSAVVTLALSDVNITCSVAPAIIFYNVYECGDGDEDDATADVDTSKAGANIVIGDNSENTINGSYVAEIYESIELSADGTKVEDSEKLHKYDAAINSKMSMNIYGAAIGNGILNVNAENEGISTDLHLTVYGGNINIVSGNDGINTNEDNVSVTTIKDGSVNITVDGKTGEGDGIDSNGRLIIEGGTVNAFACAESQDSGLDSDKGIYLRGGDVVYTGNMLDRFEGDVNSATFRFTETQKGSVNSYTIKDKNGADILSFTPTNDFSRLVVSSEKLTAGEYSLYCGEELLKTVSTDTVMGGGRGGMRPEGEERPEPKDGEMPEFQGGKRPEFDSKTPPEIPEGKDFPRGERGETPPEFDGQMPDLDSKFEPQIDESKLSDTFEIKKGANSFIVK